MKDKELNQITDFLYEVGMLQQTPRSGFQFLGSGNQTVAEHLHRCTIIAYVLGLLAGVENPYKLATMAALHDISESRISDLNYVHQKYNTRHEEKAHSDLFANLPNEVGEHVSALVNEYEARESLEAKLVKDADNLEWILSLKEQVDSGNSRASEWLPSAIARLKTQEAKSLAQVITKTRSDRWWFGDPKDEWWISRKK